MHNISSSMTGKEPISDGRPIRDKEPTGLKRPLYHMFYEVPPTYDRMNRMLTLRLDERWRKKAVLECLKSRPKCILDLCTGTGDLAVRIARITTADTEINALDFSETMLEEAQKKAVARSQGSRIRFVLGDVAAMPYPDDHFNAMIIGFAFRNLTYHNPKQDQYLSEIWRVIKPDGICVIVETSQPSSPLLKALFHFYLKVIVAGIGAMMSAHPAAYRYLGHSAKNYYSPDEVKALLQKTGFKQVHHHKLSGGVAAIYVALK
jgi:demethylmenaquinone methyltransferase/2-methoxy-6-polyprenyl-1,4-benzoquinol methylase